MATVVRRIARLTPRFLLLALIAAAWPTPARVAPTTADQPRQAVAHAYYYPEVRLRKLHLVRPDLIPYPIDYEVYC